MHNHTYKTCHVSLAVHAHLGLFSVALAETCSLCYLQLLPLSEGLKDSFVLLHFFSTSFISVAKQYSLVNIIL